MRVALAAVALGLGACGTPSYYEWGHYEDSVHAVTGTPDGFDLGAEIDVLEKQLEATVSQQRPIPPGLHAHLGYLHSVAGNPAAARQHFEQEKALFPESARFMDHRLTWLGAQP